MIELQNVQPFPLANAISKSEIWSNHCNFKKGKKYLVTAPSGKGKSTFIHAIYGLRQDFSGEVKINGASNKKLSNNDWSDIRQHHLSIVFQDLRLFPDLTALENILLNAQLNENTSVQDITTMAKALGIDNLLDKLVKTLSYGQRQRVAIIRALSQPFDMLLLDEPFSHLDPANIKNAAALIQQKCEQKSAGMILVSLNENYGMIYDNELVL